MSPGAEDVVKSLSESGIDRETYEEVVKAIKILQCETELIEALKAASVDVAEVYSPPRVTEEATRWGLKKGEAMDLTTGWDFTDKRHQEAAMRYVRRVQPKLLIGSPVCRYCSSLQNRPKGRRRKEWSDRYREAIEHIKFVVKLYEEAGEERQTLSARASRDGHLMGPGRNKKTQRRGRSHDLCGRPVPIRTDDMGNRRQDGQTCQEADQIHDEQ